jgi:hypothetical protein
MFFYSPFTAQKYYIVLEKTGRTGSKKLHDQMLIFL